MQLANLMPHRRPVVGAPTTVLFLLIMVAFESLPLSKLASGLQQQASPAEAAASQHDQQPQNPLMALAGGQPDSGSAALEAASALASVDDLMAAESSQSPADSPAEHKAFTSGAQLIRQEPQQLAGVSVAPVFNQQPVQQQQQSPMYPAHLMARLQASHKANFNPFMAAAMAQQQMAAAAAGMHSQVPHAPVHHHHQQQPQPQPHHHHQAQHQVGGHHPLAVHHQQAAIQQQQRQQQQQHHQHPHQMQQHQQQQQQQQQQQHQQPMAVQESAIRHNIVPAPAQLAGSQPGPVAAAAPIESNSIDESPAMAQQQQASANGNQMAVASSVQHPVVASASTSMAPINQQEAWPLQAPDIPKIVNLEVKCEKNLMKVSVEFDRVFNGVIFSKGHFSQGQCIHVGQNSGKQQAYFDISINSCGTQGNTQNGLYGMGGNTGSGTFFENTIVIQYDPNVQEVYDHARKLRCTWHDQYEKAVTFRPFPVDMLDIVRADFAGDNVGCWMQIQVGKGPWASEVAGIVKIGQTMTMVLAIKDEENKFDMLVRNCFAHDGKRGPIELVDKSGCITRPKLMSRFTKIKNFGSSATVLSYAHFQAFKFPDSMEVHFQCTIQICRHQCPEQCSGPSSAGPAGLAGPSGEAYSESTISGTFNINGQSSGSAAGSNGQAADSLHLRKYGSASGSLSRARRDTQMGHSSQSHHLRRWLNGSHIAKPQTQTVGVNRVIQVVSSGDLAFALQQQQPSSDDQINQLSGAQASQLTRIDELSTNQQICMSSYNFVLALVMLVLILLCSCLMAVGLYVRQRSLLRSSQDSKQAQFGKQTHSLSVPTSGSSLVGSASSTMQHHHHHHNHHHNQVPTSKQLFNQDQQLFH